MKFLNLFERLQVPVLLQERVHIIEFFRLYVIEKCPQFLGVILNRGTCEQQYALARMIF
jgi:hypothetical protein